MKTNMTHVETCRALAAFAGRFLEVSASEIAPSAALTAEVAEVLEDVEGLEAAHAAWLAPLAVSFIVSTVVEASKS